MQIVLREDVAKVGKAGDIVSVADGYARNYLLPKNLASKVTPSVLKEAERIRARRLEREREELKRLTELGERLSGFLCVIEARANEEGHLFGGIHERDIADLLVAQGFESILPSHIMLPEPLRIQGDHEVAVQLHPEVRVQITVRVNAVIEAQTEPEKE